MNEGERIDWHMPPQRVWTWGKVAAGVGREPVSFDLEPGTHTLRFSTRETGAQLQRVILTAHPEAAPPFPHDHEGIVLHPEEATIEEPMRVVREEGDPDTPHMRVLISAAGPLRHEVDGYDGHLRLMASVATVQPEFAAVLLPLPAGVDEPEVVVNRDGGVLRIEVGWTNRSDLIIWPAEGDRRPEVTLREF